MPITIAGITAAIGAGRSIIGAIRGRRRGSSRSRYNPAAEAAASGRSIAPPPEVMVSRFTPAQEAVLSGTLPPATARFPALPIGGIARGAGRLIGRGRNLIGGAAGRAGPGIRRGAQGVRGFLGTPTGRAIAGGAASGAAFAGAERAIFGGRNGQSNEIDSELLVDLLQSNISRRTRRGLNAIPEYGLIVNAEPLVDSTGTTRRFYVPRGYVLVDGDMGVYGVWRPVAVALGVWKPAKKPVLSVRETNAIKTAKRARNKINEIHKEYGGGRRR